MMAKLIVSVSFGSSALFRWRRQSCPDDEGHLCWLGHGDILVMDGQCQDAFLHCTNPGRDQERINVTFRWIKQHASSCPFLKAGIACCLPTCAQCSSVPNTESLGFGGFWAFMFLFSALCLLGVFALLDYTQLCTRLGSLWCASCWARPLGVLQWDHYLCDLWRANMAAHNTATRFSPVTFFNFRDFFGFEKPCLQALVGQPSLHGYDAFIVYWVQRALRRHRRQKYGKTSFFSLLVFFCLVGILGYDFGVLILWHLWIGSARHPGRTSLPHHVGNEVLNVGGWLTHGDVALEVGVDFLAVVEHRLIPARLGVNGPDLGRRGWLLSRLQPVRIPPMLVMVELV